MIYHNVLILNNKVVTNFTFEKPLKNTIMVKKNNTKSIINSLQTKHFTCQISCDIILFLAVHLYSKKHENKLIIYKNMFQIQDSKYSTIKLSILYYSQKMPKYHCLGKYMYFTRYCKWYDSYYL